MTGTLRVVVTGTGGGVGTTTIAAALFAYLAGPAGPVPCLGDRTGGELLLRIPAYFGSRPVDEALIIQDLGCHATSAVLLGLLDEPVLLVVVTAATPDGLRLADEFVGRLPRRARLGTVVVPVAVFGRQRIEAQLAAMLLAGLPMLFPVPSDRVLAAGGPIRFESLAPGTTTALVSVASQVRELLGTSVTVRPLTW
ncbi:MULTISPECIES: hypothetical protein [Cryobacterium]|uniref:CobQ/CobB/MinD/ParA nucleotide binding domain-containing protein n=1 Tax=Cryobacterium breve TaxID=1259258 RepID=A0ABY2J2J7_9MICO|nr:MULTISPECIES: hypothetical protein [Cryobacterium]TFC95942.1 hypothetical protein E3T20_04270 [Cryobacterium sp. TmT3-12]TFC97913.1 hypothetical protein E3O65_09310 [Cryobacterium breve]